MSVVLYEHLLQTMSRIEKLLESENWRLYNKVSWINWCLYLIYV